MKVRARHCRWARETARRTRASCSCMCVCLQPVAGAATGRRPTYLQGGGQDDSGTARPASCLRQKTSTMHANPKQQHSFPLQPALTASLSPSLPPLSSPPDLPPTGARSANTWLHIEPRPHVLWFLLSPHQLSIGIVAQLPLDKVKWEGGYLKEEVKPTLVLCVQLEGPQTGPTHH